MKFIFLCYKFPKINIGVSAASPRLLLALCASAGCCSTPVQCTRAVSLCADGILYISLDRVTSSQIGKRRRRWRLVTLVLSAITIPMSQCGNNRRAPRLPAKNTKHYVGEAEDEGNCVKKLCPSCPSSGVKGNWGGINSVHDLKLIYHSVENVFGIRPGGQRRWWRIVEL